MSIITIDDEILQEIIRKATFNARYDDTAKCRADAMSAIRDVAEPVRSCDSCINAPARVYKPCGTCSQYYDDNWEPKQEEGI